MKKKVRRPKKPASPPTVHQTMTYVAWCAEGRHRFGADRQHWRFVCPVCRHVASVQDYQDAGAPRTAVAFSCIGRWLPKCSEAFSGEEGPCDYAGGGLFRLNPTHVLTPNGRVHQDVFAFEDRPPLPADIFDTAFGETSYPRGYGDDD